MITRRTKVQLAIFALITMLGVSFVGARYARLDRLVHDTSYTVVAHFHDSGGMYAGGMVSYRGVRVGQVQKLCSPRRASTPTWPSTRAGTAIPSDALAVVGNRSAVGEQYVDLQPQTDHGPYLHDGSQIAPADTRTPLPTAEAARRHLPHRRVGAPGLAAHHGPPARARVRRHRADLQRIIDTGTSFIHAANANFDTTTALIRDGNTVLRGPDPSARAIRSFAHDLRAVLRHPGRPRPRPAGVIDNGSVTATELRTFLEDNKVDLASLINNLVTTGDVVVKHLPGMRQVLVVYPYVVEGGFTVVSKSPATGLYDAHFGMVLTHDPAVCHDGYQSTDTRVPQDGSNRPMNARAHCAEPAPSPIRAAPSTPRPTAPAAATARRWSRRTTRRQHA